MGVAFCFLQRQLWIQQDNQIGPGSWRNLGRRRAETGEGPCRSQLTATPRLLRWSPAPRPRTFARTSPAGCSSSLPRDSACLSRSQTRWVRPTFGDLRGPWEPTGHGGKEGDACVEYLAAYLLLVQLPLKPRPPRHCTWLQNSSESHMPRCPVLWIHRAR